MALAATTLRFANTTGGNTSFSVGTTKLTNENGSEIEAETDTISFVVDSHPFENGIPGVGSQPPTDPDGDGLYEDVNGDGTFDFQDAVDLVFVDSDRLSDRQVAALDFDGDGDLDFDDGIELSFQTGTANPRLTAQLLGENK